MTSEWGWRRSDCRTAFCARPKVANGEPLLPSPESAPMGETQMRLAADPAAGNANMKDTHTRSAHSKAREQRVIGGLPIARQASDATGGRSSSAGDSAPKYELSPE